MNSGKNVLGQIPHQNVHKPDVGPGYSDGGNGGGNSGAVLRTAPKLGLSAYQDPSVPVGQLPKRQGGS